MKGLNFDISKARRKEVKLDYIIIFITIVTMTIDLIICKCINDEMIDIIFFIIFCIALVNFIEAIVNIIKYHNKEDYLYKYM